jgi:hypothetical protein
MIAFLLTGCQAVLSGALLFAAYAKARQPDLLAAVLRAVGLPAAVIRLLILLLPALEAGLALAVLTSPPALLPWTMGIVTGMLLLVTVWGVWVCVRRLSPACSCPSIGKRGRWSVALTCNAGLRGGAGRAPAHTGTTTTPAVLRSGRRRDPGVSTLPQRACVERWRVKCRGTAHACAHDGSDRYAEWLYLTTPTRGRRFRQWSVSSLFCTGLLLHVVL